MDKKYDIKLNFLPLVGEPPAFRIYRKIRRENEVKPSSQVFGFSLPINPEKNNEREHYWVQFLECEEFEEFLVESDYNVHLTNRALFDAICHSARENLEKTEFEISRDSFNKEIHFNFKEYHEGHEQLRMQPYWLREKRLFGWLADFHFRVREGIAFSRRIQQLSLSIDRNFKRNLDYYLDREARIKAFLEKRRPVIDAVRLPGSPQLVQTAKEFMSLPAKRLKSKVYLFSGNQDSRSQFTGLRQYGPLETLKTDPRLLFVFRECDRQAARTLAMAIQGSSNRERYSFPGFETLFKTKITIDGNPIILSDISPSSFKEALEKVRNERRKTSSVLPIFVLPEGDDNGYMQHKAIFTHEGIPTQACTLRIINDDYALRWSIGNIALQIFCKAGGKPWIVRPTQERTLIIGISQSHKIRREHERARVEKYFAFSVMSDNSGLFQQLRVLGEADTETTYLQELRSSLHNILRDRASEFSQVVIHTSFRLGYEEMKAIEQTVRLSASDNSSNGCRFAVVKINHRNRFFGVNTSVNSLVPYESTVVRLGGGEYLVWFEGIFPDKQTVTKAFPGPTHVKFLRVSSEDPITDDVLLQDLVNLSGANWRGFNAKSAPVSIFYCHLVADIVHDFHERGLPLPRVEDLRPWFL